MTADYFRLDDFGAGAGHEGQGSPLRNMSLVRLEAFSERIMALVEVI